jgi:hypothetical protein
MTLLKTYCMKLAKKTRKEDIHPFYYFGHQFSDFTEPYTSLKRG